MYIPTCVIRSFFSGVAFEPKNIKSPFFRFFKGVESVFSVCILFDIHVISGIALLRTRPLARIKPLR